MLSLNALVLATAFLIGSATTSPAAELTAAKAEKKPKKPSKAGTKLEALFKKLDTNKDGKLSPAEFAKLKDVKKAEKTANGKAAKKNKKAANGKKAKKGKKAGKTDELFKKLDANKDGSLSLSEFKKLTEVKQAAKKAKKAKKNKK